MSPKEFLTTEQFYKWSFVTGVKVLITTGYHDGSPITASEILNLNKTKTWVCPTWPNYPKALFGATGGLVEGIPTICGGYPFSNQCFTMTKDNSQMLSNMYSTRYGSASVVAKVHYEDQGR